MGLLRMVKVLAQKPLESSSCSEKDIFWGLKDGAWASTFIRMMPFELQTSYALALVFLDLTSQLELEKPGRKPTRRVNGIFWILLLNLAVFVADHLLQVIEQLSSLLLLLLLPLPCLP